jgi:hypothetical protein
MGEFAPKETLLVLERLVHLLTIESKPRCISDAFVLDGCLAGF